MFAAHPRVGGENQEFNQAILDLGGSSPRGRGKLFLSIFIVHYSRLIPAWAGKTLTLTRTQLRRRAHPRVGGENV